MASKSKAMSKGKAIAKRSVVFRLCFIASSSLKNASLGARKREALAGVALGNVVCCVGLTPGQ